MNWSWWIQENWADVRRVIRVQGLHSHVMYEDLEDFTSRVVVRLLGIEPSDFDGARWRLIQQVARRQAVDDTRRRTARPYTVPLDDWDGSGVDAYAEWEALDAVRRLKPRDGRAVLGHALGLYDHELAEEGVTLDAVSQRRRRARERMAA